MIVTHGGLFVCVIVMQHKVIRTSSVEYMPFALSMCLFLNGATWLAYALSIKDVFQLVIPQSITYFMTYNILM